jgi:uncharacterized metal-binding protein YceD (DUF177 family)
MSAPQFREPEWPVNVTGLAQAGKPVSVTATPEERRAIAGLFDLPELRIFAAELVLTRYGRAGVRIAGRLRAEALRTCVVSLQPVEERIETDLVRVFVPENELNRRAGTAAPGEDGNAELDEETEPELLEGGEINLAGPLLEEFALALDPYPRHPDARFEFTDSGGETAARDHPFKDLARLAGKPGKGGR